MCIILIIAISLSNTSMENEIYFNEKSRKKGLTIKFYNKIQKILITTKTPN